MTTKLKMIAAAFVLAVTAGAAAASQPIYPGYTGSNHPAACTTDSNMVPSVECNASGGSTRNN